MLLLLLAFKHAVFASENSFRYKDGIPIQLQEDDENIELYSSSLYSVKGIDVSHHQGAINWSKVEKQIDFAILRCSYSTQILDRYWEINADACTEYNIPFGVYIYSLATTTTQAKKEAEYVLKLVKDYDLDFPIFFDIEDDIQKNLSKAKKLSICKTFCDIIEDAGYTAGIYSSKDWWETYLTDDEYENWPRWVARWNNNMEKSGYAKEHMMWQYYIYGKVDGISTNVDMNYLVGYYNIKNYTINLSQTDYIYDGTAKKPTVSISGLKKGVDYTVSYKNNIDVGYATVTIEGIGSYTGTVTKKFSIRHLGLKDYPITLSKTSYIYDGTAKKPTVTVGNLEKGIDYTVDYANNIEAGKATVTISGIGKYNDSVVKTFSIVEQTAIKNVKATATDTTVTLTWTPNEAVTGYYIYQYDEATKNWKGTKNVVGGENNSYTVKKLTPKTTYQYKICSYYNNIKGEYGKVCKVTTKKKPVPTQIEKLKISERTPKKLTLTWKKQSGATGYQVYRYNTAKKSWQLVAEVSTNQYKDKNLTTGTVYQYRVRGYNESGKGKFSQKLTTTTLPTTQTINSVTSKKAKTITVSWKKQKATGYVVEYSTSKKFTSSKTKKVTVAKNSVTIKKLTSKKIYYVRIRAYKTCNGKKYYGKYSSVKHVKCK
jgi:GH25 family lysozyme M1 (1,4-beta-N-acetylmuramidase)/fibronectin type 3 domain-containing protein